MFIPVQVEPDVGEFASAYSLPYLVSENHPQIDYVRGLIEKIRSKRKELKICESDHWIPFHRVMTFSFGGIELMNTEYDETKRYQEDQETIRRLLGNTKGRF